MYESPVKTIIEDVHMQLSEQLDERTYQAVVNVGIAVDKEELIRALQYDRKQYEVGYRHGKAAAPQWIPVGERKPDFELQMWRQEHETEPLQVLVTIKDAREATILSYDEDGDFFAVDDYGDVEIYNVTHWQALPAVPEVAE